MNCQETSQTWLYILRQYRIVPNTAQLIQCVNFNALRPRLTKICNYKATCSILCNVIYKTNKLLQSYWPVATKQLSVITIVLILIMRMMITLTQFQLKVVNRFVCFIFFNTPANTFHVQCRSHTNDNNNIAIQYKYSNENLCNFAILQFVLQLLIQNYSIFLGFKYSDISWLMVLRCSDVIENILINIQIQSNPSIIDHPISESSIIRAHFSFPCKIHTFCWSPRGMIGLSHVRVYLPTSETSLNKIIQPNASNLLQRCLTVVENFHSEQFGLHFGYKIYKIHLPTCGSRLDIFQILDGQICIKLSKDNNNNKIMLFNIHNKLFVSIEMTLILSLNSSN